MKPRGQKICPPYRLIRAVMVKIIDIIKFFFKENFSQKRLLVILISLLLMTLSFFLCNKQLWFADLKKDYDKPFVIIFISVCFLVPFLTVELICNRISFSRQEFNRLKNELESKRNRTKAIYDTLTKLTEWQRSFLITNITQEKSQIKAYEIGGYKLYGGQKMEALQAKRIVREISFENYEITSTYYNYVSKYYNPQTQILRLPDSIEIESEAF